MKAALDVSAQFGGSDAAAVGLPHFRALKAAARTGEASDFPAKTLAFILRVDGEVSEFGPSGVGNVDVHPRGEYISVDIGCTHEDRENLEEIIAEAVASAPEVLGATKHPRLRGVDLSRLADDLAKFVRRYRQNLHATGR